MNILIKFSCIALIISLKLSPIESAQKFVYVGLPDDQCTEWKEVTEEEYQNIIKAPIKRHGQVEEEKVDEKETCDVDKTKEGNGTCTCVETLGLNLQNLDIYRKVDIQRAKGKVKKHKKHHKKSHKKHHKKSHKKHHKKSHKKHHKSKKGKHASAKKETGSFSEEFDGSEEEPLKKHVHKTSDDKADHKASGDKKDKSKKEKHKKNKHGKGRSPHKNDTAASFSEEFDGSEEEELRRVHKQKPASEGENKAAEVKSEEDNYDDITEKGNGNSESISYADSEELP